MSTEEKDLTAQRDALAALGVEPDRVYVNFDFTGKNKNLTGLREALAAYRARDTFVVTKLDRLARSVRGAHTIAEDLARRKSNSTSVVRSMPRRPLGKLLFNLLAMIAVSEADLISMPTREGMEVGKAKGRLRESSQNSA